MKIEGCHRERARFRQTNDHYNRSPWKKTRKKTDAMQFTAICLLTDAMQFTAKWLLNLRLNKTSQILAVHMIQTKLLCRSASPKVTIVEVLGNQKSLLPRRNQTMCESLSNPNRIDAKLNRIPNFAARALLSLSSN